MPKYSYKCNHCTHEFTEWQSITDLSYPNCPICGKDSKRIVSGGFKIQRKEPYFTAKDRMK